MAAIPKDVQDILQRHIYGIQRLFKSPRVTIIVRAPEGANAKGDLVFTNDNPSRVIDALRARMIAEAEILAGTQQQMTMQVKEPSIIDLQAVSEPIEPRTRPSGNNFRRNL